MYRLGKALTGTIISDEELALSTDVTEGFEKLYHYPESVAADGSTVFECYYDRNYYLLKFEMDGGYGVADVMPLTVPAMSQDYRALWESIDTTATVAYWLQNPDDEEKYDFWGSYQISAKSGDLLDGTDYKDYSAIADHLDTYEKKYSKFNESKTDKNVLIEGDASSVINVYYDRKEYTLKFYYAVSGTDHYYVVGGSTYHFGTSGNASYNEIQLLDEYMKNSGSAYTQRGEVQALPGLNEKGEGRNYTKGSDTSTSGEYHYHYLSFRARYGADIGWSIPKLWRYNLWVPCTDDPGAEETTTVKDGVTYRLLATYDTCDNNSTIADQTATALSGYEFVTKQASDIETPSGFPNLSGYAKLSG